MLTVIKGVGRPQSATQVSKALDSPTLEIRRLLTVMVERELLALRGMAQRARRRPTIVRLMVHHICAYIESSSGHLIRH